MHAPTKELFLFSPNALRTPAISGHRLKQLSVSRCPRDDLDRIRLPDDVSKEIRTERHRTNVPARRHFGPGCHDLRGSGAHSEEQHVLSVVEKVGGNFPFSSNVFHISFFNIFFSNFST